MGMSNQFGFSYLVYKRISMNVEQIREYCISKSAVTEGFPFNETALVFKVAGKMFALLDLSEEARGLTLKCDPELAIELREQHSEVTPAYHFNKQHWNGVSLRGSISNNQLKGWIDHSYTIVVDSLPKSKIDTLQ
jgi:predicted DNA-binding protein (MmcQ/YjbR family)